MSWVQYLNNGILQIAFHIMSSNLCDSPFKNQCLTDSHPWVNFHWWETDRCDPHTQQDSKHTVASGNYAWQALGKLELLIIKIALWAFVAFDFEIEHSQERQRERTIPHLIETLISCLSSTSLQWLLKHTSQINTEDDLVQDPSQLSQVSFLPSFALQMPQTLKPINGTPQARPCHAGRYPMQPVDFLSVALHYSEPPESTGKSSLPLLP